MREDINRTAFWEDVKKGLTIKALAKKYSLEWSEARSLRNELESTGAEPGPEPEPEAEQDSEAVIFDLKIEIPGDRLMSLIRGIDTEELLDAIAKAPAQDRAGILQNILQAKFDRLLEPKEAIPMPSLVSNAG